MPPLAEDGFGLAEVTDISVEILKLFRCGKQHLDAFLADRAEFMHQEHLATVWMVMHRDLAHPVGYFTLHNDSLELTSSEETNLGLSDHADIKRFPAIVIGRLAVDERLHRTGVSNSVMDLAMGVVQRGTSQRLSAARLVVVDADNDPKVLRYYERNGFERSDWADKQALNHAGKRSRTTVKMLKDILAI